MYIFHTLLAFVGIHVKRNIMKSGEMKHEMTLFHTMASNRNVYSRHPFFLWPRKVLCGDLQQDDAGPFERSLLTSTHFI